MSRISFRRIVSLGLIVTGLVLGGLAVGGLLDGEVAKYIHVRWASGLDAERRAELEKRFGLVGPEHREGTTFGYDLVNDWRLNIRRIVRHPAVEDTHSLDRRSFRVAADAPDGERGRRAGIAWWWGLERFAPYAGPLAGALLLAGTFGFLADPRALTRLAGRAGAAGAVLRAAFSLAVNAEWLRRPLPVAVMVSVAAMLRAVFAERSAGELDPWIEWLNPSTTSPLGVVLRSVLLAAGGFVVRHIAARISGRPVLSLVMALVAIAAFPVEADPIAFFFYALAVLVADRYIRATQSGGPWAPVGLTVAVGFIRFDHGVYVGVAMLCAAIARYRAQWSDVRLRADLTGFAGTLGLLLLVVLPPGDVAAGVGRAAARTLNVLALRGEFAPTSRASVEAEAEAEAEVPQFFNIRWAADIDEAGRHAKEAEYRLVDPVLDEGDESGRTWRYVWDGRSTAQVRRMLADPAIEDTHGFDRPSGEYVFGPRESSATQIYEAESTMWTGGAPWLWLMLPAAAAIRLVASMAKTGPFAGHPSDLAILPSLLICVPAARLAIHTTGFSAAAPALPALAVVAAWLVSSPTRPLPFQVLDIPKAPVRDWMRGRTHGAICFAIAVITVFLHLNLNTDVSNDHAAYLALGRQIVYGDWPIRDFRDDGSLLQILLSAAVQKAGGFRILGEMILAWGFFAAANCLTYWLAYRLTGSRKAAVIVAILTAMLLPRPYAYPKLFVYPFALLLLWRYAEHPVAGRLVAVGAVTALAFLFRIDHGVVVGASALLAVTLVHARHARALVRDAAVLGGSALLSMLPHFVYVIWAVGLSRYLESILTFGAYADATRESWPFVPRPDAGWLTEQNGTIVLLDLFLLVASTVLIREGWRLWRDWRAGRDAGVKNIQVLVTVAMWALMVPMLARGQYYTRIAEIAVPIAILGAWAAVQWTTASPSVPRRVAAATVVGICVGALCLRMPLAMMFTNVDVLDGLPFQTRQIMRLAASPPIEAYAPEAMDTEQWTARYVSECTEPDDRVLVTWFGPEVYFQGGRAFAGDRWVYLPFDNSREQQQRVVERLRLQRVPIVLVDVAEYQVFRSSWPALSAYLSDAYIGAAEVTEGDRVIRVLAHRDRIPTSHLSFMNLPCFR